MTIKTSILKSSILLVTMALLPLAAVKASAQVKDVVVDVPFAFVANHVQLPAGHYKISAQGPFLSFSDAKTGTFQKTVLTRTEGSHPIEGLSKLEFYVVRGRPVLTEVRFGSTGTWNVLLSQPKREHEVASNGASNNEPASRTIEIGTR